MTLKDAVKTGKLFRRTGETIWCMIYKGRIVLQTNAAYARYTRYISKEDDLKADDFEVKESVLPEWLKE